MTQGEIRHIQHLLRHSFDGPAWHGPAIREILEEFPEERHSMRLGRSHSPLEIVLHMVVWRRYVLRLLGGDYELATEQEMTFPRVEVPGEYAWTDAQVLLDRTQDELLEAIGRFPEADLDKRVPGGREYTWYFLLHGLLQHDAYHLGQLRLLLLHARV
jgi:uncharacterized damage-inducible protein DinB